MSLEKGGHKGKTHREACLSKRQGEKKHGVYGEWEEMGLDLV